MDRPYRLTTFDQAGRVLSQHSFFTLVAANEEAKADSRCMGFTITGPEWTRNWVWRYNPNTGRGVWRLLRYQIGYP
ncbi:MAG: hypothetical protein H6Q00_1824 [Holophagaceae bacterium]|nr:hypothetical protein [Holophagaceae bacterium]